MPCSPMSSAGHRRSKRSRMADASVAIRRARRGSPSRIVQAVLGPLIVALVLLGVLEALKRWGLLPITVPAPSEVATAFSQSWGDLLYHAQPTLLSAAAGFVSATGLALLLGSAAVAWRRAETGILRFAILVDSVPIIALTPILMVWVGNGIAPRIILATVASLFPLIIAVTSGLKSVDRNVSELFHLLGASRAQRWRKLALPSALPFLFAGLKIAAPLALLGALIAEWVSADRGLGIMMTYALFSFDVPQAWMTIVAVCGLAMLAYGAVAVLERLVTGQSATVLGQRNGG